MVQSVSDAIAGVTDSAAVEVAGQPEVIFIDAGVCM